MGLSHDHKQTLESMVDAYGVNGVLEALSDVAWDKAEHVQWAWQDTKHAKRWSRLGDKLARFVSKLEVVV